MFAYSPGATPFHRLDPRAKLGVQAAVGIASFRLTDGPGTGLLVVLAIGGLWMARVSLWSYLAEVRALVILLTVPVLISTLAIGPPWIEPTDAAGPTGAALRVLALLAVGLIYVRTTRIRESQAAVQWAVPGRVGRVLALGIGLTARFLPVLRRELRMTRAAVRMRGGAHRALPERLRLVTLGGLARAFDRADRVRDAVLARCATWEPTLPRLQATWRDVPAVLLAIALIGAAAVY